MRNKLKCMLLLLPTLAIGSSLSGTAPYTAISNMIYTDVNGPNRNGILVSDSAGNIFFSKGFGHNFSNPVSSGNSVGANFITPAQGFDGNVGATLWYKDTTNDPIQVTATYASESSDVILSSEPNIYAPSGVSGSVYNAVPVPGIGTIGYNKAGAVVLSTGSNGGSALNYYELNGQKNYSFSFFQHLSTAHVTSSSHLLISTGLNTLYVKNLLNGNDNSILLPLECRGDQVKFIAAVGDDAYLICNSATNATAKAKLYRYSLSTGSFDSGQQFNSNDSLATGDAEYKAATYQVHTTNPVLSTAIVFLEQSKSTGHIKYVNTCSNSEALGSCFGRNVSGSTLSVGRINGGVMTKTFLSDGKSIVGYAALFVGNSNYIFEVYLDKNGKYLGYITY